MDIIASAPAPDQHCPAWCQAHIPVTDGTGTHHIGAELGVTFTGGGPAESGWAHVSVERFDDPDGTSTPVEVHLDTAAGPMKPREALQLAAALERSANAALGLPDDQGDPFVWARALVDMPTDLLAETYRYTPAQAGRIQALVDDLLAEGQNAEAGR